MKKELSALTLFLIAVVSYVIAFLVGGVVGSAFGVLGLIFLALSIVRFFRGMKNKKNPPQNPPQK